MNDAQITAERRQKDRDAELQRLLDSCPDEVLMLLLQLVQERERPLSEQRPQRPQMRVPTPAGSSPGNPGVDHF